MHTSKSKVQDFILQSIIPILCSISIGFVFYQYRIFHRNFGAFQFVWSGIAASTFYYLLVFVRTRDAILGLILLFVLTLVTTESTHPAYILRDIFYFAGIGLSIFIYFKYFRKNSINNYFYPSFMLAGIYGVFYMITSEIHLGIIRSFSMEDTGGGVLDIAATTTYFGVLIGFAIGSGIAMNEKWTNYKNVKRKIAA